MTAQSNERLEDWRAVAPMEGCTFGGYQASDKGGFRSIDRVSGNRHLKGKVLATRFNDDGYVLVNLRCDSTDPAHNRVHTLSGHKVVLWTFAGPPEAGQEACHSFGRAVNYWPEAVRWGTKPENHADMVAAGTAVVPAAFPCRNAPRCPNMVKNEGRRCLGCVRSVGIEAGALLGLGMPLGTVAARFGYKTGDWVYRLAVEHGGYGGSREHAAAQHPTIRQWVTIRVYLRRRHHA